MTAKGKAIIMGKVDKCNYSLRVHEFIKPKMWILSVKYSINFIRISAQPRISADLE